MNLRTKKISLRNLIFSGTILTSILGGTIFLTSNEVRATQYQNNDLELQDVLLSRVDRQKVNGHNVKRVTFSKGEFQELKSRLWIENKKINNQINYFQELGRDRWSVYLKEINRPVYIQLDLYTEEVKYLRTNQEIHRPKIQEIDRIMDEKTVSNNYSFEIEYISKSFIHYASKDLRY